MSNDVAPTNNATNLPPAQGVYANQRDFTPIVRGVAAFLSSRKQSMLMPLRNDGVYGERQARGLLYLTYSPYTPEGGKAPESKDLISYTREEVKLLARRMLTGAHEACGSARSAIPAHHAHPKADGSYTNMRTSDLIDALTHTRKLMAGKNKGKVVNTLAQALKSARVKYERDTREQDLAETKANGDAWYARDANGNVRAFPSQSKAVKFAARMTYGADWWTEDKAERLEACKSMVHQQADAVGEVGHRDVQKHAMAVITEASHQRVRKAVQALGCPRKVYTGTGAKARMIEWIAEDIARVESVSKAVSGA